MVQYFDRNNFRAFVDGRNNMVDMNAACLHNKSKAFRETEADGMAYFTAITDKELRLYTLLGSLRDKRIKTLSYIEYNDKDGDFWNPRSKIAVNFYPYHDCDVYECSQCRRLFLVYTEYAGHHPERRIRAVRNDLIVEGPGNITVKIENAEELNKLCNLLNMDEYDFSERAAANKKLNRIPPSFGSNDIIVSEMYENTYLIAADINLLYRISDELNL